MWKRDCMRAVIFCPASLSCPVGMRTEIIHGDLPSRHFEPRLYGVGAWTSHLHFAYDLVAVMKLAVLGELVVDCAGSYFAFCQAATHHQQGTRSVGLDPWHR